MEGKIQELESGTSGARIEKVNLMEGAPKSKEHLFFYFNLEACADGKCMLS